MLLEATGKPIKYCLRDGREIVLRPGAPVNLPEAPARKLLERAPGKVRAVRTDPILAVEPGSTVTWDSPLFGRVTGQVMAVCVDGFLEVHHPLTKQPTTIPLSWMVRQAVDDDPQDRVDKHRA